MPITNQPHMEQTDKSLFISHGRYCSLKNKEVLHFCNHNMQAGSLGMLSRVGGGVDTSILCIIICAVGRLLLDCVSYFHLIIVKLWPCTVVLRLVCSSSFTVYDSFTWSRDCALLCICHAGVLSSDGVIQLTFFFSLNFYSAACTTRHRGGHIGTNLRIMFRHGGKKKKREEWPCGHLYAVKYNNSISS